MESSWRENVNLLGLNYTDVTLIARDPRYPDQWLSNELSTPLHEAYYYTDPGGIQGYVHSGLTHPVLPGQHFPYGVPVLPD